MPTRNVVLTDHQATLVEELVTSGRYQNASEAEDAYRLEALRSAVQVGISDNESGRSKTFDSKESLRFHLDDYANK